MPDLKRNDKVTIIRGAFNGRNAVFLCPHETYNNMCYIDMENGSKKPMRRIESIEALKKIE